MSGDYQIEDTEAKCAWLMRVIASSTNLAQYRKYKSDCTRAGCTHCDMYEELKNDAMSQVPYES